MKTIDNVTGILSKVEAHEKGILHRAISVFIKNSKGEWLLQQRQAHKYHSAMQWSNACCTHPLKDETNIEAANRRLHEEMGLVTSLNHLFRFKYRAELDNELIENEVDHIFIGVTDDRSILNAEEVADYRYASPHDLQKEIHDNPENFTVWLRLLFDKVRAEIE